MGDDFSFENAHVAGKNLGAGGGGGGCLRCRPDDDARKSIAAATTEERRRPRGFLHCFLVN